MRIGRQIIDVERICGFLYEYLYWLIAGGAGLLIVVAGIWGYTLWRDGPDYWYTSAQKQYERGKYALDKKNDEAAARRSFENAETLLKKLLDENTKGHTSDAWLLRYKVLAALSAILAKEEQSRGETGIKTPSAEMAAAADRCLSRAAADAQCVEAQAIILSRFFKYLDNMDQLGEASRYAANLLAVQSDTYPGLPDFHNYLIGAHYILAWKAMSGSSPRPDEAMTHLQASRELDLKHAGPGAAPPLRWREIGLEGLVLKTKTDKLNELREKKLPEWLARVKEAKDRSPAAEANDPAKQPGLTRLSPTNTRGLCDLLLLAIELANTSEQAGERTELALQVCQTMLGAEKPSRMTYLEVARLVTRIPGLLVRQPNANQLTADRWSRMDMQVSKLMHQCRAGRVPIDPAVDLALVHETAAHGCLADVDQLVHEGLAAAKAGKLKQDHYLVQDLHTEAAWSLVLRHMPSEARGHLAALDGQKSGRASLAEGMLAILDGRLENAVAVLERTRLDPEIGKTILPYLGLAYAWLGMGRHDQALPALEILRNRYQSSDQWSEEEKIAARACFRTGRRSIWSCFAAT